MIDYIQIEGFKSIKKMEMELKPMNILIGSNGSGKSNFISFFKLIGAIFNGGLQKYVMEEKIDNLLHFGRKHTQMIKGRVIFARVGEDNNGYKFGLAQTNEGGLYLAYEGSGFSKFEDAEYAFSDIPEENRFASVTHIKQKLLQSHISALKVFHFHDTSATSLLRSGCDVNDNLYLKPDGRNLPAYLYLLKTNHPKIYGRIEKTIQSIAPYIRQFILEPKRLAGQEGEIELRWVDKGDAESNFSAYQLSDGTLRFIALATLLMQPQPPDVIIIDEPELGLHPFAIGKLAGMVQAASIKCQVIIATQSPGLISHFSPEDVIVVDKNEEENQTIFKRLNPDELDVWLSEYTLGDLWERNIVNAAQPFTK